MDRQPVGHRDIDLSAFVWLQIDWQVIGLMAVVPMGIHRMEFAQMEEMIAGPDSLYNGR